ncbi:hypothetical protein JCM8208_005595 [Rhodotorula glutinis]
MPSRALPVIESVLRGWHSGGSEQATISYDLCFTMDIYAAEEYLQQHGLGPDGPLDPPPVDPSSAPAAAPPVAQVSAVPSSSRRSPSPGPVVAPSSTLNELGRQDASTSPRPGGPSASGSSSRDDSRRSENAQWPSRDERERHEPRRRSRSPDRRSSWAHDPAGSSRAPRDEFGSRSPSRRRHSSDLYTSCPRQSGDSSPITSRGETSNGTSSRDAVTRGLPPIGAFWICVGTIPMSVAERWIYEKLERNRIPPSDIFLSKTHGQPSRFAFVGFASRRSAQQAVRTLDRLEVDDLKLFVSHFRDPRTGSTQPKLVENLTPERRYLPTVAQAALPHAQRIKGLFFLHLSPSTSPAAVRALLHGSLESAKVGCIEVREQGLNHMAFADIADDDSCRKAILDLDGAVLDGQAVRVTWLERNSVWRPPRRLAFGYSSPPPRQPSTSFNPNDAPAPSSPPTAPRPTTTSATFTSPPVHAPADPVEDVDVIRLRSAGLSDEQVVAVQQLWRPVERAEVGPSSRPPAERSMTVKVDFGCVKEEDAKLALSVNAREPAFPDDAASQARYSAFLEAQAGESKDYYTAFFAKLAEFNSSSAAFAAKARTAAEEARRDTSTTMSVDEPVVKREERV